LLSTNQDNQSSGACNAAGVEEQVAPSRSIKTIMPQDHAAASRERVQSFP